MEVTMIFALNRMKNNCVKSDVILGIIDRTSPANLLSIESIL